MAKYNAAKHTIETDDGRHLATLAREIRADEGFRISDRWAGEGDADNAEYGDIESLRDELREAQGNAYDLKCEVEELEDKIEDRDAEIRRLKEELATLQEKGGEAA